MKNTRTIENGIRGYHSDFDRADSYYESIEFPSIGTYRDILKLKDRTTAMYDKRWQAACEVIDIIAKEIGIDADTLGLNLYAPDWDHRTEKSSTPILEKLAWWFERSGDKVKLKKRISELDQELTALRNAISR